MIARLCSAASKLVPLLSPEAAQSQLVLLQEMTFELPLTTLSSSNRSTGQCIQAWAVVSSGILANNLPRLHSQTRQQGNHAFTALMCPSCSCVRGPNQDHATASSCDPVIRGQRSYCFPHIYAHLHLFHSWTNLQFQQMLQNNNISKWFVLHALIDY